MGAELITGCDDSYALVAALTVPPMRRYAERHGLAFSFARFTQTDRAAAWSKISAIKAALLRGADPVIWIDADALIVRSNRDIREGIDASKDVFIGPRFNAGVLVIRNTAWSLWFLDKVWNNQLVPEHATWENAALVYTLGYRQRLGRGEQDCPDESILSHIGDLDWRWNCIPHLCHSARDAYIRHYAGLPNRVRVALMRRDLAIPGYGYVVAPCSRLALRLALFDERMKQKAATATLPGWYIGRRLAGRALRGLLSPVL
jgi:hypothetical protein